MGCNESAGGGHARLRRSHPGNTGLPNFSDRSFVRCTGPGNRRSSRGGPVYCGLSRSVVQRAAEAVLAYVAAIIARTVTRMGGARCAAQPGSGSENGSAGLCARALIFDLDLCAPQLVLHVRRLVLDLLAQADFLLDDGVFC